MNQEKRWLVRVNYSSGDIGIFSFYEVRNTDRWEAEKRAEKQFHVDFGNGNPKEYAGETSSFAWQTSNEQSFQSAKLIL